MGTHENDLKAIISQGRWEAPHIGQLGDAVATLNRAMSLLADSPGWGGEAAEAARETWVNLQRSFVKVADAAAEVERVNTNAGAALDRAAAAIGELPAGKVPSWIHNTVNAAEAGSMVFIPAMGVSVLASSAVRVFENFLGNQRENEARQASAVLEQELKEYSAQLKAIPWNDYSSTLPEPGPIPGPGVQVPDPTIRVGGGGGYTPSPNPSYDVPAYPGGGSPAPGGGSSAPGGGPPTPGGGSFPPSPAYHGPSIDDGSVGTLPGYSGGAGGGFGAGGVGASGGFGSGANSGLTAGSIGSGANSGLTAGVFGGATAAGAAALRFGTGGGFGGGFGGGMGAGGLAGGAGGAGGASGTGGLLGAGGRGAGGAAGGSAGAGAGAGAGARSGASGTGATGTGATGGARGGMMGGQPMGGGAEKKEKRSGLGGLMAPKIEDDEPEFIPLPDGARAGGRNTVQGDLQ